MLYERATLLAQYDRYEEATKDAEQIKELVREDTLRTPFTPTPRRGRLSREEAIGFLDGMIKLWKRKDAASEEE